MGRHRGVLSAAVAVLVAGVLAVTAAAATSPPSSPAAAPAPAAVAASGLAPAAVAAASDPGSGSSGGDATDATTAAVAAWEPDPPTYGVATTTDVPVPMPDGRVLRASIQVPTDPTTGAPAAGPFPVVLSLTPYGKSVSNPISPDLVSRGYIGVAVDVAGTGGSDGASELFGPVEAADSRRIVDWVSTLPNASGSVGMTGISYLAIDQLFAAAAVGPGSPLKAIFPIAAAVDPYRDLFVSGGLVNAESSLGLLAAYAGVRTLTPLVERSSDPLDALRLSVEHLLQAVPFEGRIALDVLLEGDRRFDGPYWRERAPERVLADIVANDVAVFLVGGQYDVFQRGTPLLYSGLQNAAAGRPVTAPMVPGQPVSGRFQLLFGPWHHGNQGEGADLGRLQLQWFDQWLKGRDTGIADTDAPVRIVEPDGRTYRAAAYPVETTTPHRLFLAPGGRLADAAPAGPAAPDRVVFTGLSDPCSRSTQQWSAGMVPEALCGEQRWWPGPFPGEVTYTSDPVTAPTTLAGPIGVTLHARATSTETMWVVTLDDVAPDGTSRVLSAGAQLGSLRAVDESRSWPGAPGGWLLPHHPLTEASQQPVVPGARTRYDIEIRPVFATLAPGHRLRVTVGTGDVPHLMPPFVSLPSLIGGVYTLEHDPAAPSWIDLSIVG